MEGSSRHWRRLIGPGSSLYTCLQSQGKTLKNSPPLLTGGTVEAPSLVFACSLNHADEATLRQHLKELHPEEYRRLLATGENETETSPGSSSSTPLNPCLSDIPHTLGKSDKHTTRSKTCSVCGKDLLLSDRYEEIPHWGAALQVHPMWEDFPVLLRLEKDTSERA